MKSQHIPMTIDEFDAMPRKLGWKTEYWDGQAHITPRWLAIVTTRAPVRPRPVQAPCDLRPATEQDLRRLTSAYVDAFQETIDHCNQSVAQIKDAAKRILTGFFAGNRGRPHPASQVAIHARQIIGAALIVERAEEQPLLDLLFVRPQWHRRGVATALVGAAMNALHSAGAQELTSRYLLGNQESRAWHHHFGFVDQPDVLLARLHYFHVLDELERRTRAGETGGAEMDALIAERNYWHNQLTVLQRDRSQEMVIVL